MLFNSYLFLFLFWPLAWWLAVTVRRRWGTAEAGLAILASSWLFYGWWSPSPDTPVGVFLLLLVGSTVVNWWLGALLSRHPSKALLALGVGFDLGLLGVFKYAGFAAETLAALGVSLDLPPIVLPIGISFFTFQQIAYLVDCQRDRTHEPNFVPYAAFVSFFPQLIAGPIVHAKELIPQLKSKQLLRADTAMLVLGLTTFVIGLAKKVLIADDLSGMVQGIFDLETVPTAPDMWSALVAYALQLYFDFSGYADMAIGIALTFNVRLPENFNSPYKATSVIEFWRRWHMTLSAFLRDYLYFPLGGGRCSPGRRTANLMITMLLGGLWHGAGWTFVLWGGLHGLYLVLNHLWRRLGIALPRAVGWAATFFFVVVAWLPFRAVDFERLKVLAASLCGANGYAFDSSPFSIDGSDLRLIVLCLLGALFLPNRNEMVERMPRRDWVHAALFAAVAIACLLALADPSPFLYFQF